MSRFFVEIPEKDFRIKLQKARDSDDFGYYQYPTLTTTITKDLAKVSFDCENVEDAEDKFTPLTGIHTLDNGLTFLGVSAGGDWEYPVFFIIYWDGSKLRGYIPEDGNPYNSVAKCAYGNNDREIVKVNGSLKYLPMTGPDADTVNARKRFGIDVEDGYQVTDRVRADYALIEADIRKRIVKK